MQCHTTNQFPSFTQVKTRTSMSGAWSYLNSLVRPDLPKEDESQRGSLSVESLNLPVQLDKGAKLSAILSADNEATAIQVAMKANPTLGFSKKEIKARKEERFHLPSKILRAEEEKRKRDFNLQKMKIRSPSPSQLPSSLLLPSSPPS